MGTAQVLIPITFFVMTGLVFISRGEIGKAIAHAIRVNSTDEDEVTPELREELAELRREMDTVRQELAETHERLDFTERLLAQQRTPDQLPRGT